ncbi:hypothetical protein EOM89_12840, partial [Candidatus Falkowbacteria bacterium]|nr:hypothetical protein [Candidatus Falkowbacteria bacterium]
MADQDQGTAAQSIPALLALNVTQNGQQRIVQLLLSYGVGAINPYVALETLADMLADGRINTDFIDN